MHPNETGNFLDAAERALETMDGDRQRCQTSFLRSLLRELGGRESAAPVSPAELFRAVLRNRLSMQHSRYVLRALALPSQQPDFAPRAGDLVLRAGPGVDDVGHVAVLTSDELHNESTLATDDIDAEGTQPGYYGLVIEAGAFPRRRSRPFARRLLDSRGRVPANTMLLRPRFPEPGPGPALEPEPEPAPDLPSPDPERREADTEVDAVIEDFDLFAEDDTTGTTPRPPVATPIPATIGFEFDLNVGLSSEVFAARAADMPSGSTFPNFDDKITDHRDTDASGKLADGFDVKRDGPRLEIATIPIKIDDNASFDTVVTNVLGFAKELEQARAKEKPDTAISVTGVGGHPVRFTHPRSRISKLPLVIAARGSGSTLKWPPDTVVWAAPQATVTILLEHVGDLIDAIAKSAGDGLGKALTGDSSLRLGVRSDIVVRAKRRVLADRTARIGTPLSDKTTVTKDDYSQRLAGLLMLMTSYMLCGEILDSKDYELFAKAYLPINVKAPFRDIYRDTLSAREKQVFKELYFDNRANFFGLAKDKAVKSDEDNELFPPQTRDADLDRFHDHRLTWGELLDKTFNNDPLKVTRTNSIPKKHHALGDEVLWAPISTIIPFANTKPRIALELRRIGFAAHPADTWKPLMKFVRALVRPMT